MSTIEKITVNGARLATCIDGEAGKPWLVLSNSLACTLESWRLVLPQLTRTHRVLRYDSRAHGQSAAPPGPYGMATFVDDLVGLMDHFAIAEADILGLSMGGMTALGAAIQHPRRVRRVICAAARADAIPPFIESWNTRIGLVRAAGGMAGVVDFTIERWFTPQFRAARPDIVREAEEMIRACDGEGYIACAEALKGLDLKRHLGAIRAPALFVAGAGDGGAPPAAMREMAALTPGCAYAEVSPASHILILENPEGFSAAIGPFLAAGQD